MTLQRRVLWIAAIFLLGGFASLVAVLNDVIPQPAGLLILFLWIGVFGAVFANVRCPHCGESATASGFFVTPFVGSRCRSCGREY